MSWYYRITAIMIIAFFYACSDRGNSKKTDGEKLLDCIRENDINTLEQIIFKNPQVTNFRDNNRQTALQCAICSNNIEVVKILINAGTEVNTKDNYLSTPLHDAAFHCDKDVVELLVDKGAKINEIDKYGETPLDDANNSYESMLKGRLINPASIKNYKPKTEEEKKKEEKRYFDKIEFLKKHGAKTGKELEQKAGTNGALPSGSAVQKKLLQCLAHSPVLIQK